MLLRASLCPSSMTTTKPTYGSRRSHKHVSPLDIVQPLAEQHRAERSSSRSPISVICLPLPKSPIQQFFTTTSEGKQRFQKLTTHNPSHRYNDFMDKLSSAQQHLVSAASGVCWDLNVKIGWAENRVQIRRMIIVPLGNFFFSAAPNVKP